jgi:uncharacterized protein (DUF1684 family)
MQQRAAGPLAVVGAIALVSAACASAPSDVSHEAARVETEQWRVTHEADYRRDWVTIAGLHFLEPGTHTAGSDASNDIVLTPAAPPVLGRFALDGDTVRFAPQPGANVRLRGEQVMTAVVLKDDGSDEPDRLVAGTIRVAVHRSGARKSLRVWDPSGPLARDFRGFSWFEIQPSYRVVGRFVRDAQPRPARVVNTFGDFDNYQTEGVVEFTLQGRTLRVRPFTTRPKRFYIVFKDASSGAETYGAARFLYADLRDDGTTVLDFNQAYNPPCAFNPYTTCPIPQPENRLPVKILAGERAYPVHVSLPAS